MNAGKVIDWPYSRRNELEQILEESFEGWYLAHSKKTLREIETVKAAVSSGKAVGLVMLKELDVGSGYIFYIAVAKDARGKGIGGALLNESIKYFEERGMHSIYASVEQDNNVSRKLFESRGFRPTNFTCLAKKYGYLNAIALYRTMVVVPREILLFKEINAVDD